MRDRDEWYKAPKSFTDRDRDVMLFLIDYRKQQGYPPRRVDLQEHFNWSSSNAAYERLRRLETMGYLRLGAGSRAIQILKPPPPRQEFR